MERIPVYLFTGFLEAGKTKFLMETLADPKFNEGERMLLILCEEGEEEYDLSALPAGGENISIVTFDEEQLLTPDRIAAATKRARADRVMIEYNGMWSLDTLYSNLPQNMFVYEEIFLVDATTVKSYNANMRQLVVDKLQSAQMVIFNRVDRDMDIDFMHKLVRGVTRRAGIGYEYVDGSFVPDETQDPLPFDLEAPVVEIGDGDYAVWYSHISENMAQYEGKTVSYLGMVALSPSMPAGVMAVGRPIMVCCADDTSFCPLIAKYKGARSLQSGAWVKVTGKIAIEKSPFYDGKGPVLYVTDLTPASAPENAVSTYY